MTPPAPGSHDPIVRLVFQPLVDAFRLAPRRAAATAGNLFLAAAGTLSAVRAASVDWATHPTLAASLAMAVAGALVMWGVMRFGVIAGRGMITGPVAAIHLGVRLLFLYCVVADVVQVAGLVAADGGVTSASLFRALLQLVQSLAGFASLHLALCSDPPPPARRHEPAIA